ncbi:hypothetical protein PLANPX_2389 [Lacipirellula parvula]|uniref:Uncharacterized protein n=2 Tax=Lacipirellula parvula TaxID=2650471 RepID=A0A5K7XA50_9BACT|nr:hypothetical protein PLANPX_2389 [Lacipirellula parvula]
MVRIHPVSIVIAVIWICMVVLAMLCGDLAASAGILPNRWMGIGMIFGLSTVVLVVVGVCCLRSSAPRILVRLLQLVGMAGAFWAAGTLTRAIYALTV